MEFCENLSVNSNRDNIYLISLTNFSFLARYCFLCVGLPVIYWHCVLRRRWVPV